METAVTITIECMPNNVDNVIATLGQEGWMKDENLHELTMLGKVKFIMWRYIGD